MVRVRRKEKEDDAEPESFWRGLAWDLLVAAIVVVVFFGGIYLYTGVWPPVVVVESQSMQHSGRESDLGVIDTGDMVFQQAAPTRSSVVTYLEGRANGYQTYGDFGDVIIFCCTPDGDLVIHRAIMYITLHPDGTADVPDLGLLPTAEWEARNASGPTRDLVSLERVTVRHIGFERNINLTFDFGGFSFPAGRTGFLTMGDYNVFLVCKGQRDTCAGGYDSHVPRLEDVQGRARGEFPWFGLIRLTLAPTNRCCTGWGDPESPQNSWDSLAVSLVFLVALPFLIEVAGRGWTKYVSPRLPAIPWPWRRKASARDRRSQPEVGDPADQHDVPDEPPREGSSGP